MRASHAAALSRRHVLPELGEGFRERGSLVFAEPVEWLLRGFTYEDSGHSGKDFYLWAFVQPLYIPVDHIVLSYGKRLGGPSHHWSVDQLSEPEGREQLTEAVRREGLSFLESFRGPKEFAREAEKMADSGPKNPRFHEDAAYAHLIAGERDVARRHLQDIQELVDTSAQGWQAELRTRAEQILELIADGGDPIAELDAWRPHTAFRLGLQAPASPRSDRKARAGM